MTRSTASKNPLTTQGRLPSPAESQTAEALIAHRQLVYALRCGAPITIRRPGKPDFHGAKMINPSWSKLEAAIRMPTGECVRCDWRQIHPADAPTAALGEAGA